MGEPKLIEQAYRFELSPSAEQAVFLGACCGAARFWFNQALDEVKRRLDLRAAGEDVSVPWSYHQLCSEFDREWRAERCGWQHEVVCGSYQGGFESSDWRSRTSARVAAPAAAWGSPISGARVARTRSR